MATRRKVTGYVMRWKLAQARYCAAMACEDLRRVVDGAGGREAQAGLIARAAIRLSEIVGALDEMEKIVFRRDK